MTAENQTDVLPSRKSANTEKTCDARYHLSGDMSVNLMYAEQALRDYNEDAKKGKCPPLFFQDDKLVLVSPDDEGNLTVKDVDPAKLTLLLTQCGTWSGGKRSTKDKGGYPPQDVVKMIYSAGYDTLNDDKENPAVPILKGIHTGVLLDADWNIVHTKGYNAKTKLYLTKDYEIEPIPETVTDADVKEAKELLWSIFNEFLFEDASLGKESVNYQNTIAGLSASIVRPFWNGVLPIFVTDKSNSGTGGTLLQEIIIILAYGVPNGEIKRIGFPEKGEGPEYEKTLKSAILKKERIYGFIDNVPRRAEWAVDILLSQVTGCGNVSIRPLGKSNEISCGPKMYYLINGVNLRMIPIDITRRIIPTRIVSKKSLCELKGYFKRNKMELYHLAEKMHPQVIRSFVLFRKYWIQNGRTMPKECSGNISEYQNWYDEIVGMLYAAGYTKILDNLGEIQTSENDDETHAADFIRAIRKMDESLGGTGGTFTPSQLLEVIYQEVSNCRDSYGKLGFGSGFENQTILPCLDDETAQAALKGTLTPEKLGSVLSGMKDMKNTGCDYVLRKKRGSAGYLYYLEDVLKQETLTT